MKIKQYSFILIVLLSVGGLLRFYNIQERGVFWADEAYFLNASKTIYASINFLFGSLSGEINMSLRDYLFKYGGSYIGGAKFGYIALETLSFFIFGVHDYSGIIVSAISGTISILIVYLIGQKIFTPKIAIVAGTLFTFSSYHIIYSRSALTVSLATLFILMGIYFYLKANELFIKDDRLINSSLFLAGFMFGYGYSCHYNLFWALFIMLFTELLFLFIFVPSTFSIFAKAKRFLILFFSILLPLLFWELLTIIAKVFLFYKGEKLILRTYFEQIYDYFLANGGARFAIREVDYYLKFLFQYEGLVVLLSSIIGGILLLPRLKDKIEYSILFCFSFIPLVMYSFYGYKTPHAIVTNLPFIVLFSSFGIIFIYDKILRKNKILAQIFLSIILIIVIYDNLLSLKPAIMMRNGYRQALNYMNNHDNYKHFSSMPALSIFYGDRGRVYLTESLTMDKAIQLYKDEGYRYLILDWNRLFMARQNELIAEVLKNDLTPVFTIPYIPFSMLYCGDKDVEQRLKKHSIDIYDLRDFFKF